MDCLNANKGGCVGEVAVVENPFTNHRFSMCDKHATEYLDEMARISNEYPEVNQPCPDCGKWECVC